MTDFSLACNEAIKPTRTSKTVNRFGCGHSSKEVCDGEQGGGQKTKLAKAACETQFNGHCTPVWDTVRQRQRLHRIASEIEGFLTDLSKPMTAAKANDVLNMARKSAWDTRQARNMQSTDVMYC